MSHVASSKSAVMCHKFYADCDIQLRDGNVNCKVSGCVGIWDNNLDGVTDDRLTYKESTVI